MTLFSTVSNRELNIWATLILDVVVAVYYFSSIIAMPEVTMAALAALIGKIIVFSIVFSIVIFSLINARGAKKPDERDYRFETRANAIGYYTLSVGVVLVLGHIVIGNVMPIEQRVDTSSPVVVANILLFMLILASCAKALSQLFQYRRGD